MADARLILGDCLEVLKTLEDGSVDAVVTDPPWGINLDTDYRRFANKRSKARNHNYPPVAGDDVSFDPSPWLAFPRVLLWGYHCFADRLPRGTVLVWQKKPDARLGDMLSDCELGWSKGGCGVYLFRHLWAGACRDSEIGKPPLHPTQKPVALWEWCLRRLRLPAGATVLDPYMGSGGVGVACHRLGYNFIGVEIDPSYLAVAQKRLAAEESRYALFRQQEFATA